MKQMTLQQIARACGGALTLTERAVGMGIGLDTEVTAAVLDSRKIETGALFFATVGERVDGHSFVGVVYKAGAACVVTQKTPEQVERECGVPASLWGAYILVQDTLKALCAVGEYYRSTLSIPIVGITGSVGKTSTKEFVAGVLSKKYRVLKTEGNYNNEIGVPLTLLRIRQEHEAAVVEMGISDFGEMHRLAKMARPTVCLITNIGQCHLENLKTRDGILRAKTEIFDEMDPDGEVYLNGEDDKLATVRNVHGKPVHFFGVGGNPEEEVYATDLVEKGLYGSEAMLHLGQGQFPISVPLPGSHMVINAAAAACVGRLLGLSEEEIAAGIRDVKPVSGRSRLIPLRDHVLIDDCYNANPVSMRAAIDLLNQPDTAKVAILGDMFELGEDSERMHTETGAYAAGAGLDGIICIGENARYLYRGAMGAVDRTREAAPRTKLFYFRAKDDFLEALSAQGEELLPDGCAILLKASHGMGFQELVTVLEKRFPSPENRRPCS